MWHAPLRQAHLLIFPKKEYYDISVILQNLKGISSARYSSWIKENVSERVNDFYVQAKGKSIFRIWQPGGGFDRNFWSAKAIHYAINTIEGNLVRAGLVNTPEEWIWSSAWARLMRPELVSDLSEVPILLR